MKKKMMITAAVKRSTREVSCVRFSKKLGSVIELLATSV